MLNSWFSTVVHKPVNDVMVVRSIFYKQPVPWGNKSNPKPQHFSHHGSQLVWGCSENVPTVTEAKQLYLWVICTLQIFP